MAYTKMPQNIATWFLQWRHGTTVVAVNIVTITANGIHRTVLNASYSDAQ